MTESHYYHYATKGLENDTLFGSVKAFIAGMNRIARCFLTALEEGPVIILAFCLMDNHVHFILYGTEENCDKFLSNYKRLTEIWLTKHPEEGCPGKKWEIGHWLLPDRESLIEKICYVLRNPSAAHLPFAPGGYRWSSANLLFSDNTLMLSIGKKASEFSRNKKRDMFGAKPVILDDWVIFPDGMIWPGCYVDYKRVEKLFPSAGKYLHELSRYCEDKVNLEMMAGNVSLPDGDVRDRAKEISQKIFGTEDMASLNLNARLMIAKELKLSMGASTKQIARIVRLGIEDLRRLI